MTRSWTSSVRVGNEPLGIRAIEETVVDENLRWNRLTFAKLLDRGEGERTVARAALHGGAELAAVDRLECVPRAIDRDDLDVAARLASRGRQCLQRAECHLVVVREDGVKVVAERLRDV